jgi:hypothetical protein
VERYKRDLVTDTCFDRRRGFVYTLERQADGEKSVVHVWEIKP